MKNVAINKSVFDYYFVHSLFQIIIIFFCRSLTFLLDGRLGRLLQGFSSTPSSENNTKILSRSAFLRKRRAHLSLRYFFSINSYRAVKRKMIRKSSKVYPSSSEDNNNDKKNTTTSTAQVKLKKLRIFSKKLFLHYII